MVFARTGPGEIDWASWVSRNSIFMFSRGELPLDQSSLITTSFQLEVSGSTRLDMESGVGRTGDMVMDEQPWVFLLERVG